MKVVSIKGQRVWPKLQGLSGKGWKESRRGQGAYVSKNVSWSKRQWLKQGWRGQWAGVFIGVAGIMHQGL